MSVFWGTAARDAGGMCCDAVFAAPAKRNLSEGSRTERNVLYRMGALKRRYRQRQEGAVKEYLYNSQGVAVQEVSA